MKCDENSEEWKKILWNLIYKRVAKVIAIANKKVVHSCYFRYQDSQVLLLSLSHCLSKMRQILLWK